MTCRPLCSEAISLYPTHLSLQWIIATIALERGDVALAKPLLEKFAAIDPDMFFDRDVAYDKAIFRYLAKEALALCYFREERFAEAAALYRLAVKSSPDREACELKARLAELKVGMIKTARHAAQTADIECARGSVR